MSVEDRFLAKLARGQLISQEEYDQISPELPQELLAAALAARFEATRDIKFLIEAASIYNQAGLRYEALECCSRSPRIRELHRMVEACLPRLRADYPETRLLGKLVADSFLVIDLTSGAITRFPALI